MGVPVYHNLHTSYLQWIQADQCIAKSAAIHPGILCMAHANFERIKMLGREIDPKTAIACTFHAFTTTIFVFVIVSL